MLTMRRQAREVYAGHLLRQKALSESSTNGNLCRVSASTNLYGSIIPVIDLGAEELSVKDPSCVCSNPIPPPPPPPPPPPYPLLEFWGRFGQNNTRQSAY